MPTVLCTGKPSQGVHVDGATDQSKVYFIYRLPSDPGNHGTLSLVREKSGAFTQRYILCGQKRVETPRVALVLHNLPDSK